MRHNWLQKSTQNWLESKGKNGTFAIDFMYDSESADAYEESFNVKSTDGLQQDAVKELTEKLLSKKKRTRPASNNPFNADRLDSFIEKSRQMAPYTPDEQIVSPEKKNKQILSPGKKIKREDTFVNETQMTSPAKENASPPAKKVASPVGSPPAKEKPNKIHSASGSSGMQRGDAESQNEDYVSRREFKDLQRTYRSLKERVDELERKGKRNIKNDADSNQINEETDTAPTTEPASSLYNGKTLMELEDSICHLDSLFMCVHNLMIQLFTQEYITSHSVTGQASNSSSKPKPKFDSRLFEGMMSIVLKKYTKATRSDITKKVQAVQKKYLLQKKQ